MNYLLHIIILILIYIQLANSFNLLFGYTGLLSIAHASFFGIGAYVSSIIAIKYNTPCLYNLLITIVLTGFIALLIGFISLNLRDDYYVVITFAVQIIIYSLFNNCISITGGPMGLPGIPSPRLLILIESKLSFLLFTLLFTILNLMIINRIVNSPYRRLLYSIREDETLAYAAGKNVFLYKIQIFIVSSILASIAGMIYAFYMTFIDPTSFSIMESIFIISIVIIGGTSSFWGPIVGTILLIIIPEGLRFIGMPIFYSANIKQIIYGIALIVFIFNRPQGIVGKTDFTKKRILE